MMRALLAGAATVLVASAAAAAPTTTFDLTAGLNAGWSSNPYLEQGSHGTATLGGSLSPVLTILTATGSTTVAGSATYLKYLNGYGDSRTLDGRVSHTQAFSQHLSGDLSFDASDSTSALLNPFLVTLPTFPGGIGTAPIGTSPAQPDPGTTTSTPSAPVSGVGAALPTGPADIIASRQSVRTFSGAGDLNWQVSATNSVMFNANATRGVYPRGHRDGLPEDVALGNYWSYGGGVNAGHQFNSRTRVGVALSYMRDDSRLYPDASSLQPGITLDEKLNSYWSLHAALNVILETVDLPTGRDHSTQAGFDLSLCGTYPHKSLCFTASRDTTPSGYGGLRTRLYGAVNGSIQLDERSSLTGSVGYARDKSNDVFDASGLSLLQANVGYNRTLTRRLAFNVTVGYQRSNYSNYGTASSATASAGLSISLGRNR